MPIEESKPTVLPPIAEKGVTTTTELDPVKLREAREQNSEEAKSGGWNHIYTVEGVTTYDEQIAIAFAATSIFLPKEAAEKVKPGTKVLIIDDKESGGSLKVKGLFLLGEQLPIF